MLPLHHSPSLSFVITQHSAVVFSTVPTTSFCVVIRTYTEFTLVVGHSGIEPETSDLSGLRANQLCQCPEASPMPTRNVTDHREADYSSNICQSNVLSHSAQYRFHPKGVYRFNLPGLEIAATFPRLVVTAISGGLVIFNLINIIFHKRKK